MAQGQWEDGAYREVAGRRRKDRSQTNKQNLLRCPWQGRSRGRCVLGGKKKKEKYLQVAWRWRKKEKEKQAWLYLFIWLRKVSEAPEIWIFLAPHRIFLCDLRTLSCHVWDLVPWPGIKQGSLHWELWVLATGPPGKSQAWNLLNKLIKVFTNLRHLWGGGENKTEKKMAPQS